jgi:hypothetical protein
LAALFTSPADAEPFLTRVRKAVQSQASSGAALVDDALGATVWGEIRWFRGLGSPVAPRMLDAFSVRFRRLEPDGLAGPGGVGIDTSRVVDGAAPLLWDGPHDEENFRVSFLFHGRRPFRHQALVELRPGVNWESASPAWLPIARRLRYPAGLAGDGTFELKTAGPTFLEESVVVNGFY